MNYKELQREHEEYTERWRYPDAKSIEIPTSNSIPASEDKPSSQEILLLRYTDGSMYQVLESGQQKKVKERDERT